VLKCVHGGGACVVDLPLSDQDAGEPELTERATSDVVAVAQADDLLGVFAGRR
jgi:hypothetical protein